MTPEYGATATLFPVDDETLRYLALAGRDESELAFARRYLSEQGVLGSDSGRVYARTLELDLTSVEPSLAGPSRPHDRVGVGGLEGALRARRGRRRARPLGALRGTGRRRRSATAP